MADLEKQVQLMSSQSNILRERIKALDQTLVTQQRDIHDLKTQYNEVRSATTVAYSPDGKHIASGSYDQTVKVWDSQTGKEVRVLLCHRPYRLLLRGVF